MDLLQQGISTLKAGDKVQARQLITASIRKNPRNEVAWLWLSGAVESNVEREFCLQQVLKLNPSNKYALQGLQLLSPSSNVLPKPRPVTKDKIAQPESTDTKQPTTSSRVTSGHPAKSKPTTLHLPVNRPNSPKRVVRRISKSGKRASLIFSTRQWLHPFLAIINRLIFYGFLITLPFDVQISLPFLSNTLIQLSQVCLLITLVIWLPTKLIEPRRRWLWGWWYALIPLGMLAFLLLPQALTELFPLLMLYWFIVNEISEQNYGEVALTFVIAVFTQVIILRDLTNVKVLVPTYIAQFVAVEAFVSLGLALASKHRISKAIGLTISTLTFAITLIRFPIPSVSLVTLVSLMLIFWVTIRPRLQQQRNFLFIIFVFPIGTVMAASILQPDMIVSIINSLHTWLSSTWVIIFLFVLLPLSALAGEHLTQKKSEYFVAAIPSFFLVLFVVLSSTYSEVLDSLSTWGLWLGLIFSIPVILMSIINLSLLILLLRGVGVAVLLFLLVPILNLIHLSTSLMGMNELSPEDFLFQLKSLFIWLTVMICLSIIFRYATSGWVSSFVVAFLVLSVSGVVGLGVVGMLKLDLDVGFGSFVIMVAAVVTSLAFAAGSLQILRELWPVVLGTVMAIGAWRSQRMWTLVLSASLVSACLMVLTNPSIWLVTPQVTLLIILIGLWVDKSNIPRGIRV